MMNVAFGPMAQSLAASALNLGLGDSLVRVGLNRERLQRAAEMAVAGEKLSPREVGAMAYGLGLSGEDTTMLALGSGKRFNVRPSADRVARLGSAAPSWWADPVLRVGDLGHGTRMLLGPRLGVDLRGMSNADPLPVPADTRFAALAKLVLGEHWGLAVGIRDQEWIQSLNVSHQEFGEHLLPSRAQAVDIEEALDLYHHVSVPRVPISEAPEVFGAGVSMVVAAGREWLSLFIHVSASGVLEVVLGHLNRFWVESGRGQRFGVEGLRFKVSSLGEASQALQEKVPDCASWRVMALRFPSGQIAEAIPSEIRMPA